MVRTLLLSLMFPFAAFAASPAELERLHNALDTDELIAILSEEGIEQSRELEAEMFPGLGGVAWTRAIAQIYDTDRLNALFSEAFDAALAGDDIAPLLAFYDGETGALVADLEVEARRAIMSDEVEAAARQAFDELEETPSRRLDLLNEFAELNDLVDRNVTGALNSNLAFYRGLGTVETFEMSEDQVLGEVWAQEPDIREDTTGWIFGYMTFAYETLSDTQLQAYVDMTATDAGRDLNRALFAGFDAVFQDVAFSLGAATARFSLGDEL